MEKDETKAGSELSGGLGDPFPPGHVGDWMVQLREENEKYRMVLELIITRNKLMNPVLCLDMLENQAKKALGRA